MLSFKKFLYFRNNSCSWFLTFCSFLLILVLFQGCSTQDQSQRATSAKIELIGAPKLVVEKTSYDFGEIVPGSSNTAVFNFRNAGDELLKITDVKKCCGAVTELDKEELAPGESGVLTAKYRTGQRTGTLSKKVSLFTNDPENQQVELVITGNVVQTLEWTPAKFEISPYKKDVACPDITIKSLNDTPFTIKGFKATGQCFTADFDPDQKATEFTLQLKGDADKLTALNTNRGNIRIELDHPDYETINLRFDLLPALQAIPAQILVFNAQVNESVLRSLELRDHQADSGQNISEQIESITSESGAKVDVLEFSRLQTGCVLNLEIWPYSNEGTDSFSRDQLIIALKDGRELNVPVRIFYKPKTLSSKVD